MSKYQYRLKRLYWKHEQHQEWANCTEDQKQKIEKQSPNRFEFKTMLEAVIPPKSIVSDEPKKKRSKMSEKETEQDK